MIQPMNYRVGFQRLYAVLALAWVGFVLFVTPANKVKFWTADSPQAWGANDKPAARYGNPNDWTEVPATQQGKDLSKYGTVSPARQGQKTMRPLKDADIDIFDKIDAEAKNLTVVKSEPLPNAESRWIKFLWLAAVLFLPPAIGYAMLFYVLRWIYRGFRPTRPTPTAG